MTVVINTITHPTSDTEHLFQMGVLMKFTREL